MFLFLMACTGAEPDSGQDGAPQDSTPAPWVDYYSAASVIETTSGYVLEESYWVRRFMDPERSTIQEEFVATADGTLIEVYFQVDVELGIFELSFSDESYAGTGTLEGEPWAWRGWRSHSIATDGATVDSVDAMDEQGNIHAEKLGFGASGEQEWSLVEDLSPVSEQQWREGMDALAP